MRTHLLAHPVQSLLLERQERALEAGGLFGFDGFDDGHVGFEIAPCVAELGVVNAERDARFLRLYNIIPSASAMHT